MKKIYDLEVALSKDSKRVTDTQALTLNTEKPHIGLAGQYGLYGSNAWWKNLKNGTIPLSVYEGEIVSLQFTGMHNEKRAFTIRLKDGGAFTYDLIANDKRDLSAYQIGRKLRITMFGEIKKTGDVLEMLWTVEICGG